jgi:hypothetical protein
MKLFTKNDKNTYIKKDSNIFYKGGYKRVKEDEKGKYVEAIQENRNAFLGVDENNNFNDENSYSDIRSPN